VPDQHPTAATAAAAVAHALGWAPLRVRRFPIGVAHYVFEAFPGEGSAVVVRMGDPEQREEMRRGLRLAERLRGLGVPLPNLLGDGLEHPFPFVVIERLPGSDLGAVMGSLSDEQLRGIAATVADAQRAASRFGSADRFGFGPEAEAAPYALWSAVLDASVDRSRQRIRAAGLFDESVVESVVDLVSTHRLELDAFPAIAFLHDTTVRNVIVGPEGVVSGIVDVDDLCFGDPRYPPALTLAVMLAYGGPVSYVRAWMEVAGHADDRIFRLYVATFLLDLLSEHGQSFNGNERASTLKERETVMRAFSQALRDAEV